MAGPTTTCPSCGRVVYVYRGQLLEPIARMLLTGPILSGAAGQELTRRFAYLDHACREEDIETYAERTREVLATLEALRESRATSVDTAGVDTADLDAAQAASRLTAAEFQEMSAAHALTRPCPRCQAEPGERCANLTERRRGVYVPTRAPHAERLGQIDPVEDPELYRLRAVRDERVSLVHRIHATLQDAEALETLIAQIHLESRFR